MRFLAVVLILLGSAVSAEPLRVLAIGDSLMAWHKWTGRDIPSVMGDMLGAQVENEAVAGSRFSNDSALGRAVGFDVRAQFRVRDWDVILINGGANDFLNDCSCSACDGVLNGLIGPDLSGEVPDFLMRLRQTGAQVLWMGYYASARSGQFTGCRPYLVEYDARLARFADRTEGVQFIDSEDVMDPSDRSLFAFDGIHPSPSGARRIGTYLAQSLAR
ncbi:SGNH/GDSL hydrolase family protein [Tateyamaria omphalii]|uniref:SGNH/GDSL hydrolase family protein n=1 Tax=Tateyamaria omphalii TaxID=299262 RepID=UPI001C99EF88|nr:SGNH/GDSL hydrolase family protein [Tateyamaria omphalii]MBY5933566.1 SGNH/GDSL hydrolase family protein [Tateyamaria omphalii]